MERLHKEQDWEDDHYPWTDEEEYERKRGQPGLRYVAASKGSGGNKGSWSRASRYFGIGGPGVLKDHQEDEKSIKASSVRKSCTRKGGWGFNFIIKEDSGGDFGRVVLRNRVRQNQPHMGNRQE